MSFPVAVHLPDDERIEIDSPDQWDDLVRDLFIRSNQFAPDILTIENLHGYNLQLGLADETFVHLREIADDSHKVITIGNRNRMGTKAFFLAKRSSVVIEMRCLIPFSIARRLVIKFIEDGELSLEVEWETYYLKDKLS